MPPAVTLAAALVRDLRAHGRRPAGTVPGGATWGDVADGARRLSLGLAEAGWSGRSLAVAGSGDPVLDMERELAVVMAGATVSFPGAGADARVVDGHLRPVEGAEVALEDLVARGRAHDGRQPDAAERRLAALTPERPAVVDGRRTVTHGQALWALRSVARWLEPAVGPQGPGVVLSAPGPDDPPLAAAVVGRWWPAVAGARLAPCGPGAAAVAEAGPDVALLDPATWAELAQLLRARAARSIGGGVLLHRGRLVVAGESSSRRDRAALEAARWWAGDRVRGGAGLGPLRLGLALSPVDPGTARDLAAAKVALAPTWTADGVPAPLAAGPVVRTAPAGTWARLLPGRRLAVDGAATVAFGGDLPDDGLTVARRHRVDARGRVDLPRPPAPVDGAVP